MTDPKKLMERDWMREIQKLMDRAIYEKQKVKFFYADFEVDRKNFTIAEDLLFEYEQQLSQLVYDSMLKNYNFTDEDYQVFVKLQDRLEQFLENNLEDKERSKIHLNNVKNRVYGINMPPTESKPEKIPPGIKLKRELASAIGITICSKCGTRTKIEKTEEILEVGRIGYAVCPKCGHKEKWMYGHP